MLFNQMDFLLVLLVCNVHGSRIDRSNGVCFDIRLPPFVLYMKYIDFYNGSCSVFVSYVITKEKNWFQFTSLHFGVETVPRTKRKDLAYFPCINAFKIKSKMDINLLKSNAMGFCVKFQCNQLHCL